MDLQRYKDEYNLSDRDIEKITEAKREVKVNPIFLGLTIVSLLFFLYSASSIRDNISGLVIFAIPITLVFGGITFGMYFKKSRVYKDIVKEVLITRMFEQEFEHVNYVPTKGFEKAFIDDTEMYDRGNTYASNDLLSASYKGIGFMQADVNIQNVTSNGKTTTTTTYFRGRWIVCDFIKNFEGYHQVRSNGSFFANKKPRKYFGTKTKEIDFESVEFNKRFSCYTNDEQEAFYLITPNYMDKMMNFQDFVNCEVVYGFINNKLHIAIYNNRNAFEMSGSQINDYFIDSVKYDIKLIKDVIDNLDLDLDIYR